MDRQRVSSGSPYERPIGFSRAYRVGNVVAVSGTAPVAEDGTAYAPGDVAAQTRRCLEIALRALAEAGGSVSDVVRTRTYLVDAADWEAVGRAHGEVFADVRPASTMVVVAALLDPAWRVEIELDAVID
jgi:enamine deaminase RidA (YjgF/YER057c/UK114 family)